MERLLNDGWHFLRMENGSDLSQTAGGAWKAVDLPHDFLIAQHNALYEHADGWYRRELTVPEAWLNQSVHLRFDGVYMDCDVLLNGKCIAVHHHGYTCFDVPLNGLHAGQNEIHVHIRHISPNSRWYSGAGIYRDVMLYVLDPQHIIPDGVYVTTCREGNQWRVRIQTELANDEAASVSHHLLLHGQLVAAFSGNQTGRMTNAEIQLDAPVLWTLENPCCYELVTYCGQQVIRERIGLRTLDVTADHGLFLNGERIKLHGVCLHHDLGALGAAFHPKAMRRQLRAMKAMGVNSLRTSHNPPARAVMDLCDEMGFLVVNEFTDVWRRPKTPYDYARFFETDAAADAAAWVRRDRNHPCMLMWSIGNEILDTHVDESAEDTTKMLRALVLQHDPDKNAFTTIGSNFMPWAGAQRCAEHVQAVGYNYGEKLYADHHARHPTWCIYGSETASVVSSRGVYRFPISAPILSDDDMQCSSLGNSTTSWGARDMRKCLVEDLNTPYSLGQYLWTGIDYIGEPTPYHTRSSYFGMMDTCVFPKDSWYLCKSLWNPEPMAHIGVTWDWNPGQMIDVPVMTNGASAELLLNGRSLGMKHVSRTEWEACRPTWQIPFEPGELRARAFDGKGNVIAEHVRHTPGNSARIMLEAEDEFLLADGRDMTFITVSMVDSRGRPVENANNRIHVTVTGQGQLMGIDNGDSADRDGYKTSTRRLFSGKLLIMAGCAQEAGEMHVTVTSPGLEAAVITLPVKASEKTEGVSCCGAPLCKESPMPPEKPVRKIILIPEGSKRLTRERPTVCFRVECEPPDADPQEISFRITNAKGIESPCAVFEASQDRVTVTGIGDDTVYLRAMCANGYRHPRIISQQDICVEGMGQPNLNPYGFVTGGLFSLSYGDIGNGNEQGVSFARDGESMAGYQNVDFGPIGSDEITLPIFALDGQHYDITLWDGDPRAGGEVIAVLPYQKPSQWNVYQAETWQLPRRLTGLHTLCFTMIQKIHLKGFSFAKQSRAWLAQRSLDADAVYGDSFTRTDEGVMGIGNNVSLVYDGMDFAEATRAMLVIDGCTPLRENPITLRFQNAKGEAVTALAGFQGGSRGRQRFEMEVLPGLCTVTFVFLPGCQFDFYGFQFISPIKDRKE